MASTPKHSGSSLSPQAEVISAIVGDVLAGLSITAMCGGRGAPTTAVINAVTVRLSANGKLVIVLFGDNLINRRTVTTALLRASGVSLKDVDSQHDEQLGSQLRKMFSQPRALEFVLIFDNADSMPSDVYRFMSLLLTLARDGTAKLRFILFGSLAPWPELHRLRMDLHSTYVILSPMQSEKSVLSDVRPGWAASYSAAPKTSAFLPKKMVRRAWEVASILTVLAGAGLAAVLQTSAWFETRPAADEIPQHQAGPVALALPLPSPTHTPAQSSVDGEPQSVPGTPNALSLTPPTSSDGPASVESAWPFPAVRRPPPHGLLLLAQPGDTLLTLYNRLYRGLPTPPFPEVSAMNPLPIRPGTLIMFPEPPGGWPLHNADHRGDGMLTGRRHP